MNETAEGPTLRIPRARSLEDRLDPLARASRQELVSTIKTIRQDELRRLADGQLEAINETTGLDIATSITVVTDTIIRQLVAFAMRRAQAPANWKQTVGIFALGGYGRGELAPGSDIDLLVLYTGSRPAWLVAANQELQTLLWDVGFQVGASMRQHSELERILAEDNVTATAVLEQRLLVGDGIMGEVMRDIRDRFRRKRSKGFLRYKVDELRERQQKAGANLFTMEPNTKTNPGCLRDIQFLRNTAFMLFGSRNLHALRDLGVISFDDVQRLFEANDHLLAMRCLLHARHGRHEDRLSLQDQLWLADCYGYTTGGRLQAVEQMMRLHYERVLHVYQIAELTISRLQALGHLGRRLILVKTRRRLNDDFAVIDRRVYVSNPQIWEAPDLGKRLLRTCREAQAGRFRLSIELQRAIKRNLHRLLDRPFQRDPAMGRVMLEIFADIGYIRPILEDMHWSGLLGAYLPEFGNLTALMQFNSYHQYTADEHTLIVLKNLDSLALGEKRGFPGCDEILPTIERKDLLGLSLLLHDIGKFMGSGHVPRGALMVGPIAQRMGLDEAEEDLVHFLVAEHVTLSDATRFRDIHEPAFLENLAATMESTERLDMLYVLTWCDIAGVGETVLTGWQEALARELYDNILQYVKKRQGRGVLPPKRERLLERLQEAGLARDDAEGFIAAFHRDYIYQAQPKEIAEHHQALQQAAADPDGIASAHKGDEDSALITIACPDRHGIFADLVGTISACLYDIVEARNWVTSDGACLFSCRVTCQPAARLENAVAWRRLHDAIRAVLTGRSSIAEVMARQSQVLAIHKPADSGFDSIDVVIDQRGSLTCTVLDVRVKDSPGLLYCIARTIAELNCSLTYASIATYGDVARDVFYITKDEAKLDGRTAMLLRREVEAALAERQGMQVR